MRVCIFESRTGGVVGACGKTLIHGLPRGSLVINATFGTNQCHRTRVTGGCKRASRLIADSTEATCIYKSAKTVAPNHRIVRISSGIVACGSARRSNRNRHEQDSAAATAADILIVWWAHWVVSTIVEFNRLVGESTDGRGSRSNSFYRALGHSGDTAIVAAPTRHVVQIVLRSTVPIGRHVKLFCAAGSDRKR